MGGRPEPKARQADIVDLILDLAGISADGEAPAVADLAGNGAGSAQRAGAEVKSTGAEGDPSNDVAAAPEPPAADRVGSDGPAGAGGDEPAELSGADDGRDGPAGAPSTDKHAGWNRSDRDSGDRQGRDRQVREDQGDRRPDRDRQGDRRHDRSRPDRSRQQEDQPEMGNRRRRRRGRNERDRPDELWEGEPIAISGHLDLRDDGYGFLRIKGFQPSKEDAYVSVKQVRQFGLRKGDFLAGGCRPATRNEKNPALLHIDSVNGLAPESAKQRPKFEDLVPLFPDQKLRLEREDDPVNMTCRIIDLLSPIGKGQRGLIVSPPKAGKTTIMKEIARSIELNNPEVHLLVLLVDERPEEVTDMRRWLLRGEVAASTFDRPADEHTHVAEMTIERAKRMVERGEDVVVILDGITRLSRAYNLAAPATGRIMSGGIDTGALYPPKKFFGAARNVEEGGSLTILATALVETGSRMDEVIFEEFKGTGNMELRLDRHIAERRIYPAINVDASSTRHEELLFERRQLQQVWKLRRVLNGLSSDGNGGGAAGLELLMDRLRTFPNNAAFLEEVAKGPAGV